LLFLLVMIENWAGSGCGAAGTEVEGEFLPPSPPADRAERADGRVLAVTKSAPSLRCQKLIPGSLWRPLLFFGRRKLVSNVRS